MLIFLVVLYKQSVDSSNTLTSLLACKEDLKHDKVILWDNSPQRVKYQDLEILENSFTFQYVHTPENKALSKVYNSVIAHSISSLDYLVLLDQDSTFSKNFIFEIKNSINLNKEVNLFLPVIMVNDKIVSPARNYIIKSRLFQELNPGIINAAYLMAINSGMIISGRFLKDNFSYDEELHFYGTDNYFMYKYSKKNSEAYILNYSISHNLSFDSTTDFSRKLEIFREIKKANKIVYRGNAFHLIAAKLNNVFVSLKFCVMYRSLRFLR